MHVNTCTHVYHYTHITYHTCTHTHNTHTHTLTHRIFAMTKCNFHLAPWNLLVGPIHTTHQLLHVLDLYVLDCLLKVALPRPLRSRNLLQMTPSAQILGGCVSLVPESYIQYRGIRYLQLPPHVVCTGLVYWIAVMYVVDWYVV